MPKAPEDQKAESGGIGSLLLDLADKAAKNTGKEDQKGSSFPVYIIMASIVVIGFAIMGWLAVRAKRKAAQLEYKLRLQEEEHKRAAEALKTTQDAATRAEAESKVSSLSGSIKDLKEKLASNEAESKERARVLATASGWDDLVVVSGKNVP